MEFKNVVIPQIVDDNFPHYHFSKSQSQIDEDARLLYVAMTRAKTNLLMTFYTKNNFGYAQSLTRFINHSAVKEMFHYLLVSSNSNRVQYNG